MCKLIAVATDKEGAPCTLEGPCSVLVFEHTLQGWQICRRFEYAPAGDDTQAVLRDKVRDLIKALGTCRVFAAKVAAGLAFHMLDRAGVSVFEVTTLSREVLDGIAQDVRDTKPIEQQPVKTEIAPRQSGEEGMYVFDLIAVQRAHPELSSKKALMTFFDTTPFATLTLFCTHLPPWIEYRSDLSVRATEENGVVRAEIVKACKG